MTPDEAQASADRVISEEKSSTSRRSEHRVRSRCRICRGTDLECILDLGEMPLANAFLSSPEEFESEPRYPLRVFYCDSCSLVQLLDVIDAEVLFRDYIYVTGTSETMAAHNAAYANAVADTLDLQRDDLVVEVASNDGSLLKCFRDLGVAVLGVEPASNIARLAEEEGIPTVNAFFDREMGARLREEHGRARAVIGNNVLAHVDDPRDFLAGCRELLSPDGRVIIEVPYIGEMLDRLEYDTIYHEHLCYFSVTTLMRLFEAVDLSVVRVDRLPVHGGSLRIYAGHRERHRDHAPAVREMAEDENSRSFCSPERYRMFADDVARHGTALRELLRGLRDSGHTLAGYGAPAKGNTLLNYCRIGTDLLPYTTDRNPLKVGKFTPGAHLPVLPPSELLERQPDYVLILAWNFAREIMEQQKEYAARGGRFVIPVPEPKVVTP